MKMNWRKKLRARERQKEHLQRKINKQTNRET
jgi:hypothetical protein